MTRAQGRKARDDRYYQANKDAINRRRRERRQSKREHDEFGTPRLKLVERLTLDRRSACCDPLTVSDHASGHSRHSRDEPSRYQKLLQDTQASDYQWSDLNPLPACDGTDNSTPDGATAAHDQTADGPATDHMGSDCRASDLDQASDRDSVTNCYETDQGQLPDHDHSSDHDQTSGQQTKDYKATDYETEPATTISYKGMKNPPMENLRFQGSNVYTFRAHSESKLQKPTVNSSGRIPLLVGFHLIVTLFLAALGTCLQFEFYREHDVLPGYALPLAVAGAVSILVLATVRFPGFRDWPRKLVYATFYVFFVASSSYHVLSKTWEQSVKQLGIEISVNPSAVSESRALEAMTHALEQATKNRAYKTMGILGAVVAEQMKPGSPTNAAPETAGIQHETVRWTGAVILIVLRALLEAAQAIGATALRGYFGTRSTHTSASYQ